MGTRKKISGEFEVKFTHSSKPGGQNVNKVETCVVVTHIPTGLQERCQDTRSRERNLNLAKERLERKIQLQEDIKLQKQKNDHRRELIKTQRTIRTYNYSRNEVYDHRSKTRHDLKKFMKGEIDLLNLNRNIC